MNQSRLETFGIAYRTGLRAAIAADMLKPVDKRDYTYDETHVDAVVDKMITAIRNNPKGVSYDSGGIKQACTIIGIKGTRKAIFEYLEVKG